MPTPPHTCARAQHGEDQVDPRLALGRLAEHVQAVADLGVLDLAEPAVDVQDEVVESSSSGRSSSPRSRCSASARISAQISPRTAGSFAGSMAAMLAARRAAARAARCRRSLGPGQRRHEVVDDGGVGTALGLGPLAGVVDEERVDQRQVAERRVGPQAAESATVLPGSHSSVAVLAKMDDGVGAETAVRDRAASGRQPR